MSEHDWSKEKHPLPTWLELAVPFWIAQIKESGGPTEDDFAVARVLAQKIAEHGDIAQFRAKGKTAEIANAVARGIALCAYVPGGITVFGRHWEAEP